MRVNYLGPLLVSNDHPAVQEMPVSDLPASCFLVEVSPEAGVDGELIEGDVLVADENCVAAHGDLVLARDASQQLRAYHSHRIGGCLRLMPVGGGQSVTASVVQCAGVVVRRSCDRSNDQHQPPRCPPP